MRLQFRKKELLHKYFSEIFLADYLINLWNLKFSILESILLTKYVGFYESWKFIPSILQSLVTKGLL